MAKRKRKIKIMVGSAVYGFEDQLSQIVASLNALGYEVLNSHSGSIKVNPLLSNMKNCLNAVDECDLFLGIIRPYCGTGDIGDKNITFEEIKKAVALNKPYWFLVHRDVVFARLLLKQVKLKSGDEVIIEKSRVFDRRSVDMYEYVIKNTVPVTLRNGNWVQEFYRLDEILSYVHTQFSDMEFIRQIMTQTPESNE